jgi:hypothetical protein
MASSDSSSVARVACPPRVIRNSANVCLRICAFVDTGAERSYTCGMVFDRCPAAGRGQASQVSGLVKCSGKE